MGIQFDDILGFDTVKALGKTKDKDLVELCNIFFKGSVNDLRDFQKKSGAVFKEHSLEVDDAMSKIKLLKEVAEKLEESEEGVEPWVVRAISEGIIDGRIDQLSRKVIIKSAFQRKFEKEEWSFLDSKLDQWIGNLENVVNFIGDQKALRATVAEAEQSSDLAAKK